MHASGEGYTVSLIVFGALGITLCIALIIQTVRQRKIAAAVKDDLKDGQLVLTKTDGSEERVQGSKLSAVHVKALSEIE